MSVSVTTSDLLTKTDTGAVRKKALSNNAIGYNTDEEEEKRERSLCKVRNL